MHQIDEPTNSVKISDARGYIALYRGVLDHPKVGARKPYSYFEAWCWLLFEAAWKPKRIAVHNRNGANTMLALKRGQLSHSVRYMAKAWGWRSDFRVRTFLNRLKSGAQINTQTDAGQTVITICNYEHYQNPKAWKGTQDNAQTNAQYTRNTRKEEEGNKEIIDDDEERRSPSSKATDKAPLISTEAHKLADEIAKLAGHDPEFPPPSWYGAPWTVQKWLDADWPAELILISVREQCARKQGEKINRAEYFSKGIADTVARQNTPLPQATERHGHYADFKNGLTKSGSVVDASRRLIERMRSLNRENELRGREGEPPVRLLPKG